MRNAFIQQAGEAFQQADHLDVQLIGPLDRTEQRGVERGRIASGGQDSNALHNGVSDE